MASSVKGLRAAGCRAMAPASRLRSVPSVAVRPQPRCSPVRAIELDFSDPDTQVSMAGLVLVRILWVVLHGTAEATRLGVRTHPCALS